MFSRILFAAFLLASSLIHAQNFNQKGHLYFYWGWNQEHFSKSNITFSGADYNFTLHRVIAKDRPSPFGLDPYFNLEHLTIPQYNFRLGYFINSKWDISIGVDHMKYVLQNWQDVAIDGYISNSGTPYDGVYNNDLINLSFDFLMFEHTDGLNYVNTEIRRTDRLYQLRKIELKYFVGTGIGMLVPKTNTRLLNKERYDAFHVSGFGTSLVTGLSLTFFKSFFIQGELKGGYINLPDIRTTRSETDRAYQDFFFDQYNIVFGGIVNLQRKAK